MSDCIVSLSRCDKLNARRMPSAVAGGCPGREVVSDESGTDGLQWVRSGGFPNLKDDAVALGRLRFVDASDRRMEHTLEEIALKSRQDRKAFLQIRDGRSMLDDAQRFVGRRQHGLEEIAHVVG